VADGGLMLGRGGRSPSKAKGMVRGRKRSWVIVPEMGPRRHPGRAEGKAARAEMMLSALEDLIEGVIGSPAKR